MPAGRRSTGTRVPRRSVRAWCVGGSSHRHRNSKRVASELMMSHDGFVSWSEILGFVAGVASVWLYVKQNVWAWPTGIANSLFWLILFAGERLYLDASLQVVYVGLG